MKVILKKLQRTAVLFAVVLCVQSAVFASGKKDFGKKDGETSVPGLYQYTLDNGLELFVAENDSAPLAYIELAVRAGGIAQTPETAGIFHLYEHMMFEGDSQYKSSADMDKAVQDMGVLGQNAQTGINCVKYYFTVPADLLEKGLEFWNYAIREPLLSEEGLASQKKVVTAEIEGNFSDPGRIYSYNMFRTLFPKYPWRTDPSGFPAQIKRSSTDDLRAMLKKYYIPNNAALFVGGDVEHQNVYELVQKIYGSWERGENPWESGRELQSAEPLSEMTFRVMPAEQISPEQASVSVFFRGADAGYDERAVEVSGVFDELMDDPSGFYKTKLLSIADLEIPNANYIGEGASLYRENGIISFRIAVHSPEKDLASRAKLFASTVTDTIVPEILNNKNVFTKAQFKQVRQTIKDYSYLGTETAEELLSQVEYWWVNATTDLFFSDGKKVKKADIDGYLNTYVVGKNPLVTVQVNPAVYEAQKQAFADAGFIEFTQDSAYWWKDYEKSSANADKTIPAVEITAAKKQ